MALRMAPASPEVTSVMDAVSSASEPDAARMIRNAGAHRLRLYRMPSPLTIYWLNCVEFYNFDRAYLERLSAGDPAVERHFTEYFSELILIKLRARQYTRSAIDDIRQETFLRVVQAVRRGAIREPERIGAFVNSVCKNVVLEFARSGSRMTLIEPDAPEPVDTRADSERELVTREREAQVRSVLNEMSPKNRRLLAAIFLEERSSEEVCRQFGVDQNYLRVLLFRARAQFRKIMEKRSIAVDHS
jgi:RNA polymerase sigma-70 factor (ECF subfamily)